MKHRLASWAIITLFITLFLIPSAPTLAQSMCATPQEVEAERVRVLQTELMVAALKCRDRSDLALRERYNAFVERFTPQLVQHGKALRAYFKRQYGADHRRHMDRYITGLANTVSQISDERPEFCTRTSQRAKTLLETGLVNVSPAEFTVTLGSTAKLTRCESAAQTEDAGVAAARSE